MNYLGSGALTGQEKLNEAIQMLLSRLFCQFDKMALENCIYLSTANTWLLWTRMTLHFIYLLIFLEKRQIYSVLLPPNSIPERTDSPLSYREKEKVREKERDKDKTFISVCLRVYARLRMLGCRFYFPHTLN